MDLGQVIEASEMHDSELSKIESDGPSIRLTFCNVSVSKSDEEYYRVVVDLKGVRRLTLNDQLVTSMLPQGDGSSVIAFRRYEGAATLLLNWRFYNPRRDLLALYKFEVREVTLTTERQGYFV